MGVEEIRDEVVADLMERYHLPAETARQAVDEFDIDVAREYPFHIRHYPIETLTDGVWRRFKRTCKS